MGGKPRKKPVKRAPKAKAVPKRTPRSKRLAKVPNTAIEKRIQVRPGYLVIDTSTATGGVTYDREYDDDPTKINNGQGIQVQLRTVKTVDHVEAVAALDALKKKVDYACRKYCARTAFGWFADEVSLRALRKEIDELRAEAVNLNAAAAAVGSERRARVGIVAGKLELASADAAREIAYTIRETLAGVLAALRAGKVKRRVKDGEVVAKDELHAPLLKCKNLDRLAVGLAGEAVKMALDSIAPAKKELLDRMKQGEDPAAVGAELDLGAIENAITWFEEDEIGAGTGATSNPVDEALQL
jgi:hypothetical protein